MSNPDIRKVAFDLYTPPFRAEHGYIRDANDQIVADDGAAGEMAGLIASRIRGWGRIQYMDNPKGRAEKLQDEVSNIVADALNAYWGAPTEATAMAATVPAVDPDGEAFRTAARLGLTLRMHGGCAQSSMPGSPSAYEVVGGQDPAAAMREAIARAETVIANGGESQRLQAPVADQPAEPSPAASVPELVEEMAVASDPIAKLNHALVEVHGAIAVVYVDFGTKWFTITSIGTDHEDIPNVGLEVSETAPDVEVSLPGRKGWRIVSASASKYSLTVVLKAPDAALKGDSNG